MEHTPNEDARAEAERTPPTPDGTKEEKSGAPERAGGAHLAPRKKRRVWLIVLLVLLAAVLTAGVLWERYVRAPEIPVHTPAPSASAEPGASPAPGETAPPVAADRRDRFYTFLVCGIDDGNGGADTVMVASYNVEDGAVAVMNIPRDTLVNVRWSTKKINSTYNAGGLDYLKEHVEKLIGFRLDYYVKVDLAAFVKLVDLIGGVEYEVPFDMDYDDASQDLHIHLKKGLRTLTGDEAIGVVRWRKNNSGGGYRNGDLGRIQTQQSFLTAVAKQCLQLGNVTKLSEFAEIFKEDVDTDLTAGNILWFCQQALSLDMENIHFFTMPVKDASFSGKSYVAPVAKELLELVNTWLSPYREPVTLADMDIMSVNANGTLSSSTGVLADPNAGKAPAAATPAPTPTPAPAESPAPSAEPTPEPALPPEQALPGEVPTAAPSAESPAPAA